MAKLYPSGKHYQSAYMCASKGHCREAVSWMMRDLIEHPNWQLWKEPDPNTLRVNHDGIVYETLYREPEQTILYSFSYKSLNKEKSNFSWKNPHFNPRESVYFKTAEAREDWIKTQSPHWNHVDLSSIRRFTVTITEEFDATTFRRGNEAQNEDDNEEVPEKEGAK